MKRVLILVLLIAIGVGAVLGIRACSRPDAPPPPAANFNAEVAVLGDGTPIFAPNGTIGRTLADWMKDPRSTQRYFEVGGKLFAGNSVEPLPEAKGRLTRLAAMLEGYPDAEMQIVGFAAPSGNPSADAALARDRSQRAVDLLVENGIRRERLSVADQPPAGASLPADAAPDRVGIILTYPKRIAGGQS